LSWFPRREITRKWNIRRLHEGEEGSCESTKRKKQAKKGLPQQLNFVTTVWMDGQQVGAIEHKEEKTYARGRGMRPRKKDCLLEREGETAKKRR